MNTKILIVALIALLCAGCKSDSDKKRELEYSYRTYIETKDGIRYFTTCLEGFRFVVTIAGYGEVVAGPIGECT